MPGNRWRPYFVRLTIILAALVCTANCVVAQVDSSFIAETKRYVNEIDSLISAEAPFIDQDIAEGPCQLLVETKYPSHVDSTKYSGGFSIYTYSKRKEDTLYRINHNDNLYKYRVENYYYRRNQLVCAKLSIQDWENGGKEIYKKEVYFQTQNGKIREESKILINLEG